MSKSKSNVLHDMTKYSVSAGYNISI